MPVSEALRIAEAAGLDLVEVNPKVTPPVCKIMDYGKFKYEKSKQAKAAKKHQSSVTVKEVKLRPKTDTHDFQVKVRRVARFLKEGHKVKVQIIFRGREIVHPETGQDMLQRLVDELGEQLVIDGNASMEGRRMVMTVAPNPDYDFSKKSKEKES
jgi:translation initiation factor IF-3